jgi:hypothetical protein
MGEKRRRGEEEKRKKRTRYPLFTPCLTCMLYNLQRLCSFSQSHPKRLPALGGDYQPPTPLCRNDTPESNGEGNSNPGETGKIEGEILNTCDPDLEGGLKELELPTLTCREEEEDDEVLRCLVADSPRTPRAERLLSDITCIASRTDPWAYNEMSGLRGISSEGERKVWLKNCGGFVMRCSRTFEAVRIDGGSVVKMTRWTPEARSGIKSRSVEVGEKE